ncbi:MAG: HD domain-containing protein [Pseudomonadales bacterium]|nr:HD domain-containing protein [Pseudomonadales bacterium]
MPSNELMSSLLVMAGVVEARDAYTGGHLWRVASYSRLMGEKLGLPERQVARLKLAGFLHDIGKVGVPDAILLKSGAFSDSEYNIIKTHPSIGAQIVEQHPLRDIVKDVILHHHERVDGGGYPEGLSGDDFLLHARIVSLVDAFDAMTSTRPYRSGMAIDKGIQILIDEQGLQFDVELVNTFLALPRVELEHIVKHCNEGTSLLCCPSCGPVVPLSQQAKSGDQVFCPVCSGGFILHAKGDSFEMQKTGVLGDAAALAPKADMEVVSQFMSQMPARL